MIDDGKYSDFDPEEDEKDESVEVDCPDCGSEDATYNDTGLNCPECG